MWRVPTIQTPSTVLNPSCSLLVLPGRRAWHRESFLEDQQAPKSGFQKPEGNKDPTGAPALPGAVGWLAGLEICLRGTVGLTWENQHTPTAVSVQVSAFSFLRRRRARGKQRGVSGGLRMCTDCGQCRSEETTGGVALKGSPWSSSGNAEPHAAPPALAPGRPSSGGHHRHHQSEQECFVGAAEGGPEPRPAFQPCLEKEGDTRSGAVPGAPTWMPALRGAWPTPGSVLCLPLFVFRA